MRKPAAHSAADAASMNRSAQSSTAAENADTPIEPSPPTYGATRRHSCSACARRCVRADQLGEQSMRGECSANPLTFTDNALARRLGRRHTRPHAHTHTFIVCVSVSACA